MQRINRFSSLAVCLGAIGLVPAITVPAITSTTVAASAPAVFHLARHTAAVTAAGKAGTHTATAWTASNWSGYALPTGTYTGVSGTWTVPSVAASTSATYSSAWIGVDGYSNSSLIQTGTEEDYYSGAAHYNAWWEILPAPETAISTTTYPVAPGDRMTASIYETATTVTVKKKVEHNWIIKLADTTKGWSFSTTQAYVGGSTATATSGQGTSAEWILEAPQIGSKVATLAHYTVTPPTGLGDFDNAGVLTTVPATGTTPTFTGAGLNFAADSGAMVQGGTTVSSPGNPDTPLTAFNMAYGPTAPATPVG
jgi:hypothetical protein